MPTKILAQTIQYTNYSKPTQYFLDGRKVSRHEYYETLKRCRCNDLDTQMTPVGSQLKHKEQWRLEA